ncbi:MAG: 3-demethylubiquinone-9 3-methyltransferase, partial [uncultured Blastococcus sp.]
AAAARHPQPLVRHAGPGGGRVLLLDLPQQQDRVDRPLPRGLTRPGRGGHDGRVRARRPALRAHQRRAAVHLQRGGELPDRLRRPGGGRLLLGEADRGWRRGGPVRLAQGPLRVLLAGRARRHGRALQRPRHGPGAAGHAGDAADAQARRGGAAPGGRRGARGGL